ncbi:unnamed protein product [Gadus morhua 'NCC']
MGANRPRGSTWPRPQTVTPSLCGHTFMSQPDGDAMLPGYWGHRGATGGHRGATGGHRGPQGGHRGAVPGPRSLWLEN